MKTVLSLPTLALILLTEMFAPCVSTAGTVTLTGGGFAQLSYSTGSGQDPIWAQAGTFPGLTEVQIMNLAVAPDVLLEYWVPFAAGVSVGCGWDRICLGDGLPDFPPASHGGFNLSATVDIDSSS